MSSRSKKRVRQELEDAERAAERAEMAAQRAEGMLREQQEALRRLENDKRREDSSKEDVFREIEADEEQVAPEQVAPEQVAPEQVVRTKAPAHTPRHARVTMAQSLPDIDDSPVAAPARHVAEPTEETVPKEKKDQAVDGDVTAPLRTHTTSGGVRSLLRQRLGSEAFEMNGVPVIGRGEARPSSTSTFVIARKPRRFDPQMRATIINKRVPRFDESLFPDTASETQGDMDVFETAMLAMDQKLQVGSVETPTVSSTGTSSQAGLSQPQEHPESVDASSYVDYLVHDEMERNRSGSARRFSRAHLTMIEGTADLSAAKRAATYKPRHFAPASKEA